MSECTNYSDDLKALVDGELPFARRWSVERHVAGCDTCRGEVAEMRQIGDGLRLQPMEQLDPALRARILTAIPDGQPIRSRRPIPGRFSLALAGSAAAIVALVFLFNPAHQDFMRQASSPVHEPESVPSGAAARPPAPMAFQKAKRPEVAPLVSPEATTVRRGQAYRFAEKPMDQPVRRVPATSLRDLNEGIERPSAPLGTAHPANAVPNSDVADKAQILRKMESKNKQANLSDQDANAKFDVSAGGHAAQLPTPALQAQNAPVAPTVLRQSTAGKNLQQSRDFAKDSLARAGSSVASQTGGVAGGAGGAGAPGIGGRAGGLGGGVGGGGFGMDSRFNRQESQRGAPPQMASGAVGPRGPEGQQAPAGTVNGGLATGAQLNAAVRPYGREAETRSQSAPATLPTTVPTTALLGLEVENLGQKRGEIGKIAKSVNGTLTEVGGADRKDQYRLDVLRAQPAGETELRLEVDPKRMSGVLDRLSTLGEVTVRQIPAPVRQEEKLGAEQDNSLMYRSQILDRGMRGAARNPQGDSELRQERARRFGDADKPVRLKSGNIMGRAAAPRLGAVITVLLKEKRDTKPAVAAKPALEPKKK